MTKTGCNCVMRRLAKLIVAVALTSPAVAIAVPIEGELAFSGDFDVTGGSGLADATGLSFPGGDFDVDGATGTFAAAGIGVGDIGFINAFQFNPLAPSPVDPLWGIGGFTFALESVDIILQTASFLILEGLGHVSGVGYQDTAASWNLTANTLGAVFNFSSGTAAEPVPEPGMLTLLGAGLVGLGLVGRRRNKSRA